PNMLLRGMQRAGDRGRPWATPATPPRLPREIPGSTPLPPPTLLSPPRPHHPHHRPAAPCPVQGRRRPIQAGRTVPPLPLPQPLPTPPNAGVTAQRLTQTVYEIVG